MFMAIELSLGRCIRWRLRVPLPLQENPPCRICNGTGAESYQTCDRCQGNGKLQASKGFSGCPRHAHHAEEAAERLRKHAKRVTAGGKTLRTETIKAKIPAGVDTGSIVNLNAWRRWRGRRPSGRFAYRSDCKDASCSYAEGK